MARHKHKHDGMDVAVRASLLSSAEEAQGILEDESLEISVRVHRVRRLCKKMRAVLRLIRKEAPYVYKVENRAIRDISAGLSHLRDAHVMTETLDRIVINFPDRLSQDAYAHVRGSLTGRSDELHSGSEDVGGEIRRALAAMNDLWERLQLAPLDSVTRNSLEKAYEHAAKKTRRARDKAMEFGTVEDFHGWRKRNKALHNQQAFLKKLLPDTDAGAKRLHKISRRLGQANDDAVLADFLDGAPDDLREQPELSMLREMIEEDRRNLTAEALEIAEGYFD